MKLKELFRIACLWLGLWGGVLPGIARAESMSPASALSLAYFEFVVVGYCGLADRPVDIGFRLLRHDLLARGNIDPATHLAAARKAYLEADLEYLDRGLSGQKNWCRTEGADYAWRFTHYFRFRKLP